MFISICKVTRSGELIRFLVEYLIDFFKIKSINRITLHKSHKKRYIFM